MHTTDISALSSQIQDRIRLIELWKNREITQVRGANALKISERQFRRLVKAYQSSGADGLVSKRKGKPANNRLSGHIKEESLSLIETHFYDYGPTLAAEKLSEYFEIQISKETTRQWMIEAGFWRYKKKKIPRPHPLRPRRPYFGELVQVDGSNHAWFEDRGPKATLLVFIDDATSRLLNLRFAETETTIDYLDTLKEYIKDLGAPRAMYFDKHNVFHINQKTLKAEKGITQFTRVLKTYDISPIYAHSPQAKGRVERVNETLQDRLIKELRYYGINDIDTANKHLEGYIKRFNEQFGKTAQEPADLHRKLTESELATIDYDCATQTIKTVSKDLLIRHNRELWKVTPPNNKPNEIMKQKVVLCEDLDGKRLFFKNEQLEYTFISKSSPTGPTFNRKNLDQYMDKVHEVQKDLTWS